MVGSEGTLGVITEVTLRLHGIPEAIAAGVCPFPSVEAACKAAILTIQSGIPVARIELLDALQVKASNAYSKLTLPERPMLFLEFHGSEAGVAEQSQRFGEIAQELGGGPFEWATRQEDRNRLWQARHDAYWAGRSRCAPARRRSPPTSACRSRGLPNASPRLSATWRPASWWRRSSAMSATAISISPCSIDMKDPAEVAGAKGLVERLIERALRPWTAPAPASTAWGRGR